MDLLDRFKAMVGYLAEKGIATKRKEIADAIGVVPGTISTALSGNKNALTQSLLYRVDDAFGNIFSPAWLSRGVEPMLMEDFITERMSAREVTLDLSHHNATGNSEVVDYGSSGVEVQLLKQKIEMLEQINADLKTENERLRLKVDELHSAILASLSK